MTFNVMGANEALQITAAQASGSLTEDAGPTVLMNGNFEFGDLTGWTALGGSAEFTAIGGAFGDYSARMGGSLSQDVPTTPRQHYTLSFVVAVDVVAGSSSFSVLWDGVLVLAISSVALGFTYSSFDVIGDASNPTTHLEINGSSDALGILLDRVAVETVTGPATETVSGSLSFSDFEGGVTTQQASCRRAAATSARSCSIPSARRRASDRWPGISGSTMATSSSSWRQASN